MALTPEEQARADALAAALEDQKAADAFNAALRAAQEHIAENPDQYNADGTPKNA